MMEFIANYGLFLAKTITVLAGVLVAIGGILVISKKSREPDKLEIKDLNKKYQAMEMALQSQVLSKKELKAVVKRDKAKKKAAEKKEKKEKGESERSKKNVFVVNFHGDIKASNASSLREEITTILTVATKEDEVLVNLENTGGIVHEHGLAASQLQRIREAGVPLTVAVDKVAASGGYMMACVGDRIIAAPFAVIGSIGVLAQIPNFHELLSKHGVKFEQETAGEYKRTLTMFGKNTQKERAKLREQIEDTHILFKDFVAQHRPSLELEKVATGEYWYGTKALELGLVDEIKTSDDYLLQASKNANLYEITYAGKKTLLTKLMSSIQAALGSRPHVGSGPQMMAKGRVD